MLFTAWAAVILTKGSSLIDVIRPRSGDVIPSSMQLEVDVALHGRGIWLRDAPSLCPGVDGRDVELADN